MPRNGAPEDTGQSEPNASARAGLVDAAYPVLLVSAFDAEARNRQHRHQRVQLRPQRLHVRDHPELGEPADVGVIDQLRVRDHRPPVPRPVAPHHMLDRVQCLAHCRVTDRVNVDLQPQIVDPACRLGQRVALPVPHAVVVQRGAVRRKQRAGLVLDDAVGEELHRLGGEQWRIRLVDAAACFGEMSYLGIEVARIGVEGKVESHAERVAPGGFDVCVDIGGFDPRVLYPRHATSEVVIGRRTERRHPHILVALRHYGRHAGPSRPTRATCRAPTRPRGAGSHRGPGPACRRRCRRAAAQPSCTTWCGSPTPSTRPGDRAPRHRASGRRTVRRARGCCHRRRR